MSVSSTSVGGAQDRILPLSPHDIAKIKSTATITGLEEVIIGLIQNSLDASAGRIYVQADFPRGACVVEDDGIGIQPSEFEKQGGLGKPYWTSKRNLQNVYGFRGLFISSVASLSSLVITSRCSSEQSSNTLILHGFQNAERQIPSSSLQQTLSNSDHGTMVTVKGLFGNVPVRLKQRSLNQDEASMIKERSHLKYRITALLLAWAKPIVLTLKHSAVGTTVTFRTSSPPVLKQWNNSSRQSQRSVHHKWLEYLLSILTCSSFIMRENWPAWLPISASCSKVSIKGAISLDPSPTKNTQFISVGIYPVTSDHATNILYHEINQIFSSSKFGVIDRQDRLDDAKGEAGTRDKRFKHGEFTSRQLRHDGKGVDRWPMFYLRIEIMSGSGYGSSMVEGDNETILMSVINSIGNMITEWLHRNHFQPRKWLTRVTESKSRCSVPRSSRRDCRSVGITSKPQPSHAASRGKGIVDQIPLQDDSSFVPSANNVGGMVSQRSTDCSFFVKDLSSSNKSGSRAKSSRTCSFSHAVGSPIANPNPTHSEKTTYQPRSYFGADRCLYNQQNKDTTIPTTKGRASQFQRLASFQHDATEDPHLKRWIHPTTKEELLIDARSGIIAPTTSSSSGFAKGKATKKNSLRLEQNQFRRPVDVSSLRWMQDVIENWHNPIFPLSINSVPKSHNDSSYATQSSCLFRTSKISFSQIVSEKISITELQNAEMISQLDGKFILAKVASKTGKRTGDEWSINLFLVDQHAADERIKVEGLFQDLCMGIDSQANKTQLKDTEELRAQISPNEVSKPIQFQMIDREIVLLKRHTAFFARWGILYKIEANCLISLTHLPPAIIERCTREPKLIIELIRTEIWNKAPSRLYRSRIGNDLLQKENDDQRWLRKIHDCPTGLVEMLNSRACRSAIMFNDELTNNEATGLIRNLAKCAFPFQCAHGRPSMVLLGNLDFSAGTTDRAAWHMDQNTRCSRDLSGCGNFISTFRAWHKSRIGSKQSQGVDQTIAFEKDPKT